MPIPRLPAIASRTRRFLADTGGNVPVDRLVIAIAVLGLGITVGMKVGAGVGGLGDSAVAGLLEMGEKL